MPAEPLPAAESASVCDKLHSQDSGHRCIRPRGHRGYHYSYSGAMWLVRYIRYGKPDDDQFAEWWAARNDGDIGAPPATGAST